MRRFMLIAAVLPPVFACGDALAINISPSESPYAILEPQTVSPPAPPVLADEHGSLAPQTVKPRRSSHARRMRKAR
jgi:hypothetical protein